VNASTSEPTSDSDRSSGDGSGSGGGAGGLELEATFAAFLGPEPESPERPAWEKLKQTTWASPCARVLIRSGVILVVWSRF